MSRIFKTGSLCFDLAEVVGYRDDDQGRTYPFVKGLPLDYVHMVGEEADSFKEAWHMWTTTEVNISQVPDGYDVTKLF
jgi:hypothetical protein